MWTKRSWTAKPSPSRIGARRSPRHHDLRRVLDDKTIDAVVIATPNHWHALATVWACQAGKDVYVEKPFCYNIWEGRQMVAAARKYGRMVQVGTQNRSSPLLRQTFDYSARR
jgi:predicted dehydrogenase